MLNFTGQKVYCRVFFSFWYVSVLHNVFQYNLMAHMINCLNSSIIEKTSIITMITVCVNEGQDKLPTMYWLPKLHKRPYKARFIANSSSCTTTELSKLLTSCLTAIKSHVIRYCETVYATSNKNWFWSIKILGRCSVN